MKLRVCLLMLPLVLVACTASEVAPPAALDGVVPGSIGMTVRSEPAGVVVTGIASQGPAARAGVRVGDILLRYNGEAVVNARQFYRLVVDSRPRSVIRLELLQSNGIRELAVPVEQLDTAPRV
jgi:S1-C subfamily serine protease